MVNYVKCNQNIDFFCYFIESNSDSSYYKDQQSVQKKYNPIYSQLSVVIVKALASSSVNSTGQTSVHSYMK